jgi:hypothetical protein
MKITLVSNAVAYNLYTLCVAVDPNLFKNCRGLSIQLPDAAIEAANAGASCKIGTSNAAATAVDPLIALSEGDTYNFPQSGTANTISLKEIGVIASANNAVLYVNPEVA